MNTVLRSKIPTDEIPVALYVPIAFLKNLGARLAESSLSSYVIMFKEVPLDNVRGAWYKDPSKGIWKRLLLKGGTNHLITAATYPTKIATKEQREGATTFAS